MIDNYAVSVITPVYNTEKYLNAAFNSLRKQTIGFKNIEWIAVDDHSSDRSFDMLQKWAAKYPNIKVYQTAQNSGSASLPRNIALKNATAEYVMFLDSDDIYEPDAILFLLDLITANDVGLATAAYQDLVGHSKKGLERRYIGKREGLYNILQQIDEWFPISHPFITKIFKTAIIREYNLQFNDNLRIGEDSLFIFQYMQKIEKAWHSNHIIYNYRYRNESVSHDPTKQYFLDLLNTFETTKATFKNTDAYVFYDKFVEISVYAIMDILCDSINIPDDDCIDLLEKWFPILKYASEKRIPSDTAIGSILADDAGRGSFSDAKFHFNALRTLYAERRAQFDEFFNSRGWKMITAVNRFLGR